MHRIAQHGIARHDTALRALSDWAVSDEVIRAKDMECEPHVRYHRRDDGVQGGASLVCVAVTACAASSAAIKCGLSRRRCRILCGACLHAMLCINPVSYGARQRLLRSVPPQCCATVSSQFPHVVRATWCFAHGGFHCPLWYQSDVLAGGWINVSDCAVLHCGQGGLASRQAGHMERVGWEGLLRLELPCRYCNVSTIYRSTPPQSLCLERRCCAYVGHLRMRWPL
jgi:hypothetical protein